MSELKITKGSNITWNTATYADIEKAREVETEKMQAMVFIQHSSRQYDGLWREMENNMSKGWDDYPTMVTLAYNLMLEWQPKPSSMQGGSVQRNNYLAFAEHNDQGNSKRTAKIYKKIHATSVANSDTTAGHDPSKRTSKKNWRIKEAARTTSCRKSIAQQKSYQVWMSTTKQTRAMEKKNTTPSPTMKTTTPSPRQARAFSKSLTTWIMTPEAIIHTGFFSEIRARCTCSATALYSQTYKTHTSPLTSTRVEAQPIAERLEPWRILESYIFTEMDKQIFCLMKRWETSTTSHKMTCRKFSPSIHPTNGSISKERKGTHTIITANLTARSVTSHSCTLLKKINKASQIQKFGTQKRQDPHTTWWYAHHQQISSAW